jgi:hypothetical protein
VLTRPGHTSTYSRSKGSDSSARIFEGERTAKLGVGQRLTFDTDPIVLQVSKYESGYGYSSRSGDQLDGYVVEVRQGAKVLAVDAQPQDTKRRLDAIKAQRDKK